MCIIFILQNLIGESGWVGVKALWTQNATSHRLPRRRGPMHSNLIRGRGAMRLHEAMAGISREEKGRRRQKPKQATPWL